MKNIEHIVELFKQAHKNNKLSHLYLLSGEKGSGKKKVSFEVAAYLLNMDIDSVKRGHINVYFIEPINNIIRVQQIEELQAEFSKTSLVGGYRIFIIDQAETFNIQAANQLLKFLEEPTSSKTIGFLLTTNKDKMIKTIVSRSQNINLPAPTEKDLTDKLMKNGMDQYSAECLPYLDKNTDTLKIMAEEAKTKLLLEVFDGFTTALIKGDSVWLYSDKHLNDIKYDKITLNQFLQLLLVFYLDLFKMHTKEEPAIKTFIEKYQQAKISKKKISKTLDHIQNLILKLNYNVSLELAFNELLLNM